MFRRSTKPPLAVPAKLELDGIKRLICVSPHPDDETLGCGGTLARAAGSGTQIMVVLLTRGERESGPDTPDPSGLAEVRNAEFHDALTVLGVQRSQFIGGRDTMVSADAPSLTRNLAEIITDFGPEIILMPSPRDAHGDHRAAAAIVEKAARNSPVAAGLFAYEVWNPVDASHIVDISAVVATKRRALDCYKARLRSHDLDDAILALNRYRAQFGLLAPGSSAEAFEEIVRRRTTRRR